MKIECRSSSLLENLCRDASYANRKHRIPFIFLKFARYIRNIMSGKIRNAALLSVFSLLILKFTCYAEIPAGYYNGIDGLKDSALKTKLYTIIKNHKTNDYSGLFRYSFIYTDVRDDDSWWDMYSDTKRYVYNNRYNTPSGMNREHCLPKSWWGGDENPAYTDLNHLYPSDAEANSAKLNWPLGEVDPKNVDFDNGVSKTGSPVKGQGGGAGTVFEPDDEYKGDFARTYFYMVTCYQDFSWRYTYMTQNGTYPSMKQWAIDLLLKWHREDPVSEKEKNRNDQVYNLQYNRNPYIDYPELVEYIWGKMVGKPYSQGELPPTGEGTLTYPINESTIEFGNVIVGNTKVLNIPIRGKVSDNLSVLLSGTAKSKFAIPTNSIAWKEINDGNYELSITYRPTTTGDDEAFLLLFDGGLQGVTSYRIFLKGKAIAKPTFDRPVATEATDITETGFRANWQIPSQPTEIDYYVVNFTESANGNVRNFSITTDDNTNHFDFTEAVPGAVYTYTVQSSLYGELSPESNVITVEMAGVDELSVQTMRITSTGNGIAFACDKPQTNVTVADIAGRTVATAAIISDGDRISLPQGVYIVYSRENPRPIKVMVK